MFKFLGNKDEAIYVHAIRHAFSYVCVCMCGDLMEHIIIGCNWHHYTYSLAIRFSPAHAPTLLSFSGTDQFIAQ